MNRFLVFAVFVVSSNAQANDINPFDGEVLMASPQMSKTDAKAYCESRNKTLDEKLWKDGSSTGIICRSLIVPFLARPSKTHIETKLLKAIENITATLDSYNFKPDSGGMLDALNVTVRRIGSQREELAYQISFEFDRLQKSMDKQVGELKKTVNYMKEQMEDYAVQFGRTFPRSVN